MESPDPAIRATRRHREPPNPWVERSQAALLVAFVGFVAAVLLWFIKGFALLPLAAALVVGGAVLGFWLGPKVAVFFQFA